MSTMAKIKRCSPEMPNILWIYRGCGALSIGVGSVLLGLCLSLSPGGRVWADEVKPKSNDVFQILTGSDAEDYKQNWNSLYKRRSFVYGKEPSPFLKKKVSEIPVGRALDIAMGEGRNAVFLAKKGFRVDGVDISEVALKKAKRFARENKVKLTTIAADLNNYTIPTETYDLIVNIDFLLRGFVPKIKRGLKHGGIVVFENYTVDQLKNPGAENFKRAYLLELGELKQLFSDFKILSYQEVNDGKEAKAQLMAQKP